MKNDLKMKQMQYLGCYGGIDFYQYTPTLFKPYYKDYPKEDHPGYEDRIAHKVRMFLEYLRGGYRVIYMRVNGEIAGHIVVANGGRRLAVSQKNDIVLGTIYITPRMRGKGIGTIGINTVLHKLDLQYRHAYEFIMEGNTASIRTVEKTDMFI